MLTRLVLGAAASGYVAAWLLQISRFRSMTSAGGAPPRTLTLVAVSLHLGGLVSFWAVNGTLPLVGLGPASATLALAVAVAFLLSALAANDWSPGLLVLPAVALLLAAAVWTGVAPAEPRTGFRGPWLAAHVVAVLSGYASLLLGSVAAAMYLLQFRALKRKEFGNVFRAFPSLESLDRMIGIGVAAGLCVLMTGLLVGVSFEATFGEGLELADPAVGFGILTWAAYAAALGIRWTPGGRGRLAAVMTVVAFATSGLAYLALRALAPNEGFFL